MEIKKIEKVSVLTTDGRELVEGQKIVWDNANGECFCGIYRGLDRRNNLVVDSLLCKDKEFHLMPKAINHLFIASIDVIEEDN